MRLRILLRPAIWSGVVAAHVIALLATAWVQWRIGHSAPDVLVTVAPTPPPPPQRTATESRSQRVTQSPHARRVDRVPVARRRVASAVRSTQRVAGRSARAGRTTVETTCTVVESRNDFAAPIAAGNGDSNANATGSTLGGRGLSDREASPLPGCVAPSYPRSARRAGHTGVVLLRVHLDAMGVVCRVTLERSSGRVTLDRAALVAVRAWRFAPRVRSGVNVACELIQPVSFRLR